MKIKIFSFELTIEWLFLIVIFISILSVKIGQLLQPFFMCYLFIVFHELSHILVGNLLNQSLKAIKLSLCGMSATFEKQKYITYGYENYMQKENWKKILIYLAGPIANIALALLFRNNLSIFQINMSLAILNLIPIYPLDGYQIFQNLLSIFQVERAVAVTLSKVISSLFLIIFVVLACFVFVVTYNPGMFIFVFYLYLLKKENDKIKQLQLFVMQLEP